MLYLIGTGLYYLSDIPHRALEILRRANEVYLETYTNVGNADFLPDMETLIGKRIKKIDREHVESDFLIERAAARDVVLLVPGDPLSATTHVSLLLDCKKRSVHYEIVHASSIFSAIGETGLSLYKFGAVCSIPIYSENFRPESFFDVISKNLEAGLHTLVLMEARSESEFLGADDGINLLKAIERKRHAITIDWDNVMVASRLGSSESVIVLAADSNLAKRPPISIVIPGRMNETEKSAVRELVGGLSK